MGKKCAQLVAMWWEKYVYDYTHYPHIPFPKSPTSYRNGVNVWPFPMFICNKITYLSTTIYDKTSLLIALYSPLSTPPTTTTTIYN